MMGNEAIIIECGNCGFLRHIPLTGTPEEIESHINDTIQDGWRYTKKWQGYICPKCKNGGIDPLYEAFAGKTRCESKVNSYKYLLFDVVRQQQAFKDLNVLER